MTEERRAEFQEQFARAHFKYQAERDHQYEIYKKTCAGQQDIRDAKLARLDPEDEAEFSLTHERYDKAVRRASHIFKRYEESAWAEYMLETARLRHKYGISEEVL